MKYSKNIVQEKSGKTVYQAKEDSSILLEYKDTVRLTSRTEAKIKDLGEKHLFINSFFLDYLNAYNVPTGYKKVEESTLILQNYSSYPFTITISNIIDRRTSRLFDKPEGTFLILPVFEFRIGGQDIRDNLITESHLISLDILPIEELKVIKRICTKVNAVLKSYFERRNSFLSEVTCYFGKDEEKIFIVDDFTPVSLKVLSLDPGQKNINPYKIKTPADYKEYVEFILSLTKY
ncbi:MAG TPA: phosphoribosylaminoimidazolesuccinocarboxamide synthase [Ignavibacteriales bacterium]|nr:phosphoribosylaminoimidazolesuccinocarboxamide synthase [Ignavibacteriales bacterium]